MQQPITQAADSSMKLKEGEGLLDDQQSLTQENNFNKQGPMQITIAADASNFLREGERVARLPNQDEMTQFARLDPGNDKQKFVDFLKYLKESPQIQIEGVPDTERDAMLARTLQTLSYQEDEAAALQKSSNDLSTSTEEEDDRKMPAKKTPPRSQDPTQVLTNLTETEPDKKLPAKVKHQDNSQVGHPCGSKSKSGKKQEKKEEKRNPKQFYKTIKKLPKGKKNN